MLWIVLRTISEAIYNLETGLTYVPGVAADAEAPGWIAKVHRDIKPGNIFLKAPSSPYDSFPQPVLADIDEMLELFGYMAYTRKCYLHTAGYTAPENNPQLQHDIPIDRGFGFFARNPLTSKSDIWSLGVVCGK
jgi:serine/threonine protein kinase